MHTESNVRYVSVNPLIILHPPVGHGRFCVLSPIRNAGHFPLPRTNIRSEAAAVATFTASSRPQQIGKYKFQLDHNHRTGETI